MEHVVAYARSCKNRTGIFNNRIHTKNRFFSNMNQILRKYIFRILRLPIGYCVGKEVQKMNTTAVVIVAVVAVVVLIAGVVIAKKRK